MKELDDITGEIIDAALKVHQGLGPGLYFGAATLKEGLHRIVNDLPSSASPRFA